MENLSHVRAGGKGKRRASRKSTDSQTHLHKNAGVYENDRERVTRTCSIVPTRYVMAWRVTWHDKDGTKNTREFAHNGEQLARVFAGTLYGAYVERVKVVR